MKEILCDFLKDDILKSISQDGNTFICKTSFTERNILAALRNFIKDNNSVINIGNNKSLFVSLAKWGLEKITAYKEDKEKEIRRYFTQDGIIIKFQGDIETTYKEFSDLLK